MSRPAPAPAPSRPGARHTPRKLNLDAGAFVPLSDAEVKKLHGVAEDHRVAIRNIRRDSNDQVKKLTKDKKIAEDEDRRAHDEMQKLTDSWMQKLDQAAKAKEKEILEIR